MLSSGCNRLYLMAYIDNNIEIGVFMSLDKKDFEVEKSGSVATVTCTDDNAFFAGDVSKKDIETVFKHSHDYVESCTTAASDMASDIMSKDKKIDEVVFTMPYGISKRGKLNVKAKRSVTFPGMSGRPDVTRSDLRVVVKDPHSSMSKTKLKELQAKMTEELLG